MKLKQLDLHPTYDKAPQLALQVARIVRDTPNIEFRGPQPAQGCTCSMCNRQPGSRQQLFEILLDPVRDEGIRIGIDICAGKHLRRALEAVLTQVEVTDSTDREEKIKRLRAGIAAVSGTFAIA